MSNPHNRYENERVMAMYVPDEEPPEPPEDDGPPKWVIDPEAVKYISQKVKDSEISGFVLPVSATKRPDLNEWILEVGAQGGELSSAGWILGNVFNFLPALLRLIELADAMAYETWESCAFDCKCCAGCRGAVEKYWEARGER